MGAIRAFSGDIMDWRLSLLKAARNWEKRTGRKRSGLAAEIMNDTKFFDRLERGGGCNVDSLLKVKNWFLQHAPEDLDSTGLSALVG